MIKIINWNWYQAVGEVLDWIKYQKMELSIKYLESKIKKFIYLWKNILIQRTLKYVGVPECAININLELGRARKIRRKNIFWNMEIKPVSQQKWDVNTFSYRFPIGFTGPALS